MIIICGKTIAEVERDLEMAKQAIASGMPYGVGGATIADAEKGLEMMRSMMGGAVAPIDNPNYIAPADLEDEDEDICPKCGATYDEGWNGEVCDSCGYGCEDEDEIVPPAIAALVEMLRYLGADEDTINKLLS
jgi:hypothetical protein